MWVDGPWGMWVSKSRGMLVSKSRERAKGAVPREGRLPDYADQGEEG
jgi:hypothetical protein